MSFQLFYPYEMIRALLPAAMAVAVFLYVMSHTVKIMDIKAGLVTGVVLMVVAVVVQYSATWFAFRTGHANGFLIIYMGAGLIVVFWGIARVITRAEIPDKKILVLFVVYMCCLLYITIFMRDGSSDTSILVDPVSPLKRYITEGDFRPVRHLLLNTVMFVPFGFFITLIDKENPGNFLYALSMGLMLSALIESVQLVTVLGQCDMSDVLGNMLGAGFGNLGAKLFLMVERRREYACG